MFSNEFEFNSTKITIMDDSAQEEDVTIEMSDDHVDIWQFNETLNKYDLITMTPKMLYEMLEAFQHSEGLFSVELHKGLK